MGFVAEQELIREQLVKCLDESSEKGISIAFENRSLDPKKLTKYLRVQIKNSGSQQITLGCDPEYRYSGILLVQIFAKPNTGSRKTSEIVDILNAHFKGKRFGNVSFKTGSVDFSDEIDGWYQKNYSIPFTRDE